ncbi:hypothetical protein SBV1_1760013 [Verrucomicrobia bacterium]|nr:hypothetical protein SBV1_1760013 [Verrucomicrobiota bacterium]
MEELLSRTSDFALAPEKKRTLAVYPSSGFATLPLRIRD